MHSKQALFLISILFLAGSVCADTSETGKIFDRTRYYPGSFPGAEIIEKTKTFLGVPYELGGESLSGMDCSGLVYSVFSEKNKNLPRNVAKLMKTVMPVRKHLRSGDLLFFDTVNDPSSQIQTASHVGIYIGQGEFIHAASDGRMTGVIRSDLRERYYKERYMAAGRLLEWIKPLLAIPLVSRNKIETVEDTLPARLPFDILVINNVTGKNHNETIDLLIDFIYEDKPYFSKRISFQEGEDESTFSYAFREGEWKIRIKVEDMDSHTITFQVDSGA